MHNRANYKANLRALVVSWNQAAGDEDNIDDEMKRVCTKCDKQGLYDSGTFLSRTIYQPDNPSVLPVVLV